jgi:hypothetical protein
MLLCARLRKMHLLHLTGYGVVADHTYEGLDSLAGAGFTARTARDETGCGRRGGSDGCERRRGKGRGGWVLAGVRLRRSDQCELNLGARRRRGRVAQLELALGRHADASLVELREKSRYSAYKWRARNVRERSRDAERAKELIRGRRAEDEWNSAPATMGRVHRRRMKECA